MCGRFGLDEDTVHIIDDFADNTAWRENWHAPERFLPTDTVPILVTPPADKKHPDGTVQRRAELAQWWLTPAFAKQRKSKHPLFNARSETVTELPSFRDAVRRQRAIIPAAYYLEYTTESTKTPQKKTPYRIAAPTGPLFFAGLYSWWADPQKAHNDPERWLLSTTILTQPATGQLAEIHPRCPVPLPHNALLPWLDPRQEGTTALVADALSASQDILKTLRAESLYVEPLRAEPLPLSSTNP